MTGPASTRAVALLLLALAAPAAAAPVRVVKATLGSKGAVHGTRFIVEDPRTTFASGSDRTVIAHFEWEGAPGVHECVATWKDPTGAVVLTSPLTQRATTSRFSVYWTLMLPDAPKTGLWAVEATVDGEPAGTLTFSIQPGASQAATGRRPLTPADLYGRANAGVVAVEALDAAGKSLRRSAGFVLDADRVATAFQAVEGAARVRVTVPSAPAVESEKLASWNRRQDWAVLSVPGAGRPTLATDRGRSWKIGDRVFFLEIGGDGSRAIAETSIVGAQEFAGRGSRILLAVPFGGLSQGGPLLNEYGEAIAILGGTLTPGIETAGGAYFTSGAPTGSASMAVPTLALDQPAGLADTLPALAARGVFPSPLVGARNVLTGTVARAVDRRNANVPIPVDEKFEFARADKEAVAFLTWDPQEKREGMAAFRIYNEDNRVVMQGKPEKLKLELRKYLVSTWPFPIGELRPGTYRIDLVMDEAPVWRSFFRVTE